MPSPIAPTDPRNLEGMSPEERGRIMELEIRRRRGLIAQGSASNPDGFAKLAPDIADLVLRDVTTGRARRARGGSTRSAVLGAFDVSAPLGADSILGSA